MPQDFQGNYTPPAPPTFPAEAGTTISAEYFNAIISDIANAINTALLASGARAMTGNLTMNNNRIMNLPVAQQRHEAVSLETLIKRAILTTPFPAIVTNGIATGKFQLYTGAGLTEYTAGQVVLTRYQNNLYSSATLDDQIKLQIDSLPEIDFNKIGANPITNRDLGLGGNAIFVITFDGTKFVAELVYNTTVDVFAAGGYLTDSEATSLGIGKYLLMNKPVRQDVLGLEGVIDQGELTANAVRRLVGTASGTYQVATLHGRGLYVLDSLGPTWTAGVKYGFFCEPGAGTIVLANPMSSTHTPPAMGFGATLQFPQGGYSASLYKVF